MGNNLSSPQDPTDPNFPMEYEVESPRGAEKIFNDEGFTQNIGPSDGEDFTPGDVGDVVPVNGEDFIPINGRGFDPSDEEDLISCIMSNDEGDLISSNEEDFVSTDEEVRINPASPKPRGLEVSVFNGSHLEKLAEPSEKKFAIPRLERDYTPVRRVKRETAISPLAPAGSRRAYQPRHPTTLQPQIPTANKLAHRSNTERYEKLSAKVRNAMSKVKAFTTHRIEDSRSRERLFKQLRQRMPLPAEVGKCFKRLVKNCWKISNPTMRDCLQQYSFADMCDIFRLSNLDPQEYIYHLGWMGTLRDEPEILEYIVLIGKHAAGLTPWPGHDGK
ncbi:hypothetical protein TWF225_011477 [Orbilia oligospora]|uniref:Uncharacterized protein n=1 Tax=Orbilia oligospora TaxID=2813651 RepID=A0A8H2DMT7_ORBOL|nr:hypothetical protein TWF225_011477 [Orbilia oligospora]KAF3257848.1 hypothetical protein TWF217_005952 [Orbilia oligospora]KAF3281424.1 hypothetical protein TWF132_011194 [Orbilia oligospora]TGJ62284.1 hypothetical protein EYR41_002263 [Orbilia oligospora]